MAELPILKQSGR